MKRVIIIVTLISGYFLCHSQEVTTPMLNYSALEKKLVKSDENIKDEKKNINPKTWTDRGELFQDINDVNIEFLRFGMPTMEAKLYLKEPIEIKMVEEADKPTEEYVYERVTLIFENDALVDWKETQVIHENPLPEAFEAYKKALELDDKGKLTKNLWENFERMKRQFEVKAIQSFNKSDYKKALEAFEYILKISDTEVYDDYIDTIVVYNAALAAKNAGDHASAAKYFKMATEYNYGGSDAYYLLKNEYIAMNDSDAAIKVLLEGFNLYPDTTLLLIEIVNYYLTSGNVEEGLKYLEVAQQKEGDNASIYFAQGTLFEKIGDKEKAMESYLKSLEIDPEYFNAYFNIGALYFNNAVELYDIANMKEDLEEYNEAKKQADEELKKAIEPMEKAYQINPDERAVLETLQTIYYRLQMMDKYEEIKKKLEEL